MWDNVQKNNKALQLIYFNVDRKIMPKQYN